MRNSVPPVAVVMNLKKFRKIKILFTTRKPYSLSTPSSPTLPSLARMVFARSPFAVFFALCSTPDRPATLHHLSLGFTFLHTTVILHTTVSKESNELPTLLSQLQPPSLHPLLIPTTPHSTLEPNTVDPPVSYPFLLRAEREREQGESRGRESRERESERESRESIERAGRKRAERDASSACY